VYYCKLNGEKSEQTSTIIPYQITPITNVVLLHHFATHYDKEEVEARREHTERTNKKELYLLRSYIIL
jgi:hypothetical protein